MTPRSLIRLIAAAVATSLPIDPSLAHGVHRSQIPFPQQAITVGFTQEALGAAYASSQFSRPLHRPVRVAVIAATVLSLGHGVLIGSKSPAVLRTLSHWTAPARSNRKRNPNEPKTPDDGVTRIQINLDGQIHDVVGIGHSRRTSEEFVDLVKRAGIQTLVDVRTRPLSQWNPQFNRKALQASLAEQGITYLWEGELLGGKLPELDGDFARYIWENPQGRFTQGIARLLNIIRSNDHVVGILCSEKKVEECHRRFILAYLEEQYGAKHSPAPEILWQAPRSIENLLLAPLRPDPPDLHPDLNLGNDGRPEEVKELIAQAKKRNISLLGETVGSLGPHNAKELQAWLTAAPESEKILGVEVVESTLRSIATTLLRSPQAGIGKVRLYQADVRQMPLIAPESVQLLFGMGLVLPDRRIEGVREIIRILKPGGLAELQLDMVDSAQKDIDAIRTLLEGSGEILNWSVTHNHIWLYVLFQKTSTPKAAPTEGSNSNGRQRRVLTAA